MAGQFHLAHGIRVTRKSGKGPLILSYHGVGGSDGVSTELLRAQLELLLHRREVLPLVEAVERLGSPAAGDLAVLTFDDGYEDFAECALPILRDLGLPATLFVPAAHVGGTNQWDAGIRSERRLLDAGELAALDRSLVEIGAHGYSHIRMVGLGRNELDEEVRRAGEVLAGIVGYRPLTFAYPYGLGDDFDRDAERAVAEAGYLCACSARYGRGSTPAERFRLRRVTVHPGDGVERFERKLDGFFDWFSAKERLGMSLRRLGVRQR